MHGRGRKGWELGVSRWKLVYIELKSNKVLVYRTGNYIQCPVINHSGKEHEKEHIYTCICIIESLAQQK